MSIFLVWLFLSCLSSTSSTKDDEIALLKIKTQLGNPKALSSWVEGFNFCNSLELSNDWSWSMTCSFTTGRVITLDVGNLDVIAPFPDAICNLTELEGLAVYNIPGLYGPIPSCITELFNLNTLVITMTSLSGSLPSFMNHTKLFSIVLRGNHLSGTIPLSLSIIPKLHSLDLSKNYFTGTIPLFLSTLPNLNSLDLSSNYLIGTVPSGLVHGSSARLLLANNSLTGELPRCYGWVDFSEIDVGNNQLSGDASFLFSREKETDVIVLANNEFEFDLSYVEFSEIMFWLDLSHNKIYGKISDSFKNPSFHYLDLSFNRLCGEIPQGGNLWKINTMAFSNNTCLCGYPLPPCSTSASTPAPVLEAAFDSSP